MQQLVVQASCRPEDGQLQYTLCRMAEEMTMERAYPECQYPQPFQGHPSSTACPIPAESVRSTAPGSQHLVTNACVCRMAEKMTMKRGRPSRGQTPSYTGPTDSDGPMADDDEMDEEVVGEHQHLSGLASLLVCEGFIVRV